MKKIFLKTLLAGALVSLVSCNIGLGSAVDILAPTVNVVSPERTGYILRTFTINGTAKDNLELSSLTLDIEPLDNPTPENSYKFRIQNNKWEKYDASAAVWNLYENEYSPINASKNEMNWSLTVTFPNEVQTGTEFNITTQVYDPSNNSSPSSKDERSVTVDMNEPTVSITIPAVTTNYATEQSNAAGYELKNNSIIEKLINGEFTIKGSQKEDGRLKTLDVYLDEKTVSTIDEDTLLSDSIFHKQITDSNQRNWSVDVNLAKDVPGYNTGKHIVRLITKSQDEAGNIQTQVQGWFTYWNEADKPWDVTTFGGDSDSNKKSVYPSCALQGQTYDDDGIKSITVTIYKNDETTPFKDPEVFDLESEGNPKYKAWSVEALSETCSFKVVVQSEDINGNKSEIQTRYLSVTDTNPPSIVIETDTSEPMFGDSKGDITIEGYVKDDGDVSSLKIVRIVNTEDSNTIIKYYDDSYTEWSKVNNTTKKATDTNGNQMWYITLGEAQQLNPGHKRTFEQKFNIFSDFNIDGNTNKLTAQTFIILAEDSGGCSKIDSFTYSGDSDAPTVTIDELIVYKSDKTTEKESIDFAEYKQQNKEKKLQPFEKDASDNINEYIEIKGTWGDNSTDNWDDKTKYQAFTVNLQEYGSVIVTPDSSGAWTTGKIKPKDVTTEVITVTITDLAGNSTSAYENYFVNSTKPQLLRISSSANDGSYKAGAEISISMEFNKPVKYSLKQGQTSGSKPTLTLNVPKSGTKKTITCNEEPDTLNQEFTFTYTVAIGDDINILDVTASTAGNFKWEDESGLEVEDKNIALPTSANNKLSGSRSICIDTVAPEIDSITAISAEKAYKKGETIYIQAKFDEDVNITDVSKLKLNLNAKSGLTTTTAKKTGSDTVMFTYVIGDNENASPLQVKSVTFDTAGIKDIAGNALATGKTAVFDGIVIDTTAPGKPTISGVTNNAYIYTDDGASFTVTGTTAGDTVEYSVDNGSSWSTYSDGVTLTANGEYNITARVTDAAGNVSPQADTIKVIIDKGIMLTSVSAGVPTGTYTTGKVIPIYLNFRKNIKVSTGSTLTLNNGKTAVIASADVNTAKTKITYNYTVAEGDASNGLNISAISGTFTDESGNNLSSIIAYTSTSTIPSGKNLLDGRTIKVVTGKPVIQSVALSGNTLNITFSTDVTKGDGSVTLTQSSGYKAPCVLSKEDFGSYKLTSAGLASYYSLGTNGSDEDGNPDTTEKYVLNYNTDSTDTTLIQLLQAANADKVSVDVRSSYVSVNNKVVSVELADSYAPPVKGATYTVQIDSNFVKDKQNHSNDASNTYTVTVNGIENPVIRINKLSETLSKSGTTWSVTLPYQTSVKVDCQTPGVTLTTKTGNKKNTATAITKTTKPSRVAKTGITASTTQSANPFTIGEATDSQSTAGYIYKIQCTASKTGQTSVTSYEFAYRSVLVLTGTPSYEDSGREIQDNMQSAWVRGGNVPSGTNTISTFPLSWDTSDFSKVRAMNGSGTGTRTWITWELNDTCYFQFLRGTNIANWPDDVATNGPTKWVWGMEGNASVVKDYPLYPGQSISYNSAALDSQKLKFYYKHTESRNADGTVNRNYN